ncbi:cytochrome P450 [Flavobacteriaceae bacterium (ex Bugula neritina AB1)]|nr:cytochrome P450 [Flavobacteriaceae bacterium (ex Bugula neritina AB1)]
MKNRRIPVVTFFRVYANARRILKNPLPFHRENFDKHGDIFEVQLGFGESAIFTRNAGLTKHILQKQHRKYFKSNLQSKDLAKYIGEGLLTSNGEKWLRQRRLIQPAFHKKKLQSLAGTIKNEVKSQLSKVQPEKTIDVLPVMSDLAFKVVAKSLLSYTDVGNTISRLQEITEAAQKTLIKEIRQPYKKWWFNLSGRIKNTLKTTKEGRDLLNNIIEERKRSRENYDDLLDMLLESRYDDGSGMDNEQLIDEIMILFIAGHETTANTLSFTLWLLALHPDIQDKVLREVSDVDEEEISFMNQFAKCPYTKQCIEEAMRLYPPAYFSDRKAIENDEYQGVKFKKGDTILISFYEIHRHTDFWEDPDIFNPDRFNTEKKKGYSDWYFPFGAGPRMCIGNNFAMFEMILVVSELIKKYQITTENKTIEIKPLITLKPLNANLKFIKR